MRRVAITNYLNGDRSVNGMRSGWVFWESLSQCGRSPVAVKLATDQSQTLGVVGRSCLRFLSQESDGVIVIMLRTWKVYIWARKTSLIGVPSGIFSEDHIDSFHEHWLSAQLHRQYNCRKSVNSKTLCVPTIMIRLHTLGSLWVEFIQIPLWHSDTCICHHLRRDKVFSSFGLVSRYLRTRSRDYLLWVVGVWGV